MTATQKIPFTVPEIRCAIEVIGLGRAYDVPEALRSLAEEIAQRCQYVYRITEEDLTTYLDSTGAFGGSLQIRLELAYTDALGEAEENKADRPHTLGACPLRRTCHRNPTGEAITSHDISKEIMG